MRKIGGLLCMMLIFVSLVGCATKAAIDLPKDQYSLLGRTPGKENITFSCNLIHRYKVWEGDEYWIGEEHLNVWEPIGLHKNSHELVVVLFIANVDKHPYQVFRLDVVDGAEPRTSKSGFTIAQPVTRLSRNKVSISLPITQGVNGTLEIYVMDEDGNLRFSIGEIKYAHKKEVVQVGPRNYMNR